MGLKERLQAELKDALRRGERAAVSAIRLTLSEIKNAEIDRRRALEEGELVQLLRAAAKKRHESIALFRQGGRADLVDAETAELAVLEKFLPAGLGPEQLAALVEEALRETQASSPRDLGRVMKWIVPRLEGRADGAEVNKLIRERLSQLG